MTALTHSPADVLRWTLIGLGVGTNPVLEGSWPINVSSEPDDPDNLITLIDTSGVFDGRIMQTGEKVEFYGVSIQVRAIDHVTAWPKVEALKRALDESVHNYLVIVGSTDYSVHAVTRQSGPIALGREPGSNRLKFSMNVLVSLSQLA